MSLVTNLAISGNTATGMLPSGQITAASDLQTISGSAFDGAGFGATKVFFPSLRDQFVTTSFPVQQGVHTLLITGLAPNTAYGVTIGSQTVTLTPGGTGFTSDSAGALKVSF